MEAGKRTISDIFNGNRKLIIPFFQRNYVWKEEQWARLIEDMEYISATEKDYFLGSIILKSQQTSSGSTIGDVRTIIDGQQRLTTIAIFLKVLGIKSNAQRVVNKRFTLDDDSLALQHSQWDTEAFETVMNLETLEDIDAGSSNILKAYNYFKENVDESKLKIQMIISRAQFVGIDLDTNEDEQQIFDTINSLGVKLTTGELLKNYFFSKETKEEYNKYWKPVFEADEECREFWDQETIVGRMRKNNIESFLLSYLMVKLQDPTIGVSTEDKMLLRRTDGLFNNYKKFINWYILKPEMSPEDKKTATFDFVNDLTEYAKIYKTSFNPAYLGTEIASTPSLERLNVIIYGLEANTTIPYLMFVQKNIHNEEEKAKIFAYLESYLMRRLVCKSSNNNYSDLFTENLIGNDIRTADDLKNYIQNKNAEASVAMPSNLMLRKAFQDNILPNKRATGVLYMLESRIRNAGMHSTGLLGFNSYSLEHLMPKKWRNNWGMAIDPDNRDYKLQTLGNLAIITSSLNSSIRDAIWEKKLAGTSSKGGLKTYAAGLVTMEQVLASDDWDEEKIDERAVWLADKAISIWPSYAPEGEEITEEPETPTTVIIQTSVPEPETNHSTKSLDQTTFSLDGSGFMKKGKFVRAVIRKYMEIHPNASFDELKRIFPDSLLESGYRFKGLLCKVEDWNNWQNDNKMKRYYVDGPDAVFKASTGERFYVNTQWTIGSVKNVVAVAEREGFVVTSKQS